MKRFSRNLLVFSTVALLTGILVTSEGCQQKTGDIPYNEDVVRNHILPIQDAITFTRNFRDTVDTFDKQMPQMKTNLDLGKAESFPRDVFAVLLNQKDTMGRKAAGIRIYYGLDAKGLTRQILVPYDVNGNDIINRLVGEKAVSIPGISSAQAQSGFGQTIEDGQRCPTVCDDGSSGLSGN